MIERPRRWFVAHQAVGLLAFAAAIAFGWWCLPPFALTWLGGAAVLRRARARAAREEYGGLLLMLASANGTLMAFGAILAFAHGVVFGLSLTGLLLAGTIALLADAADQ